MRQIAPLLALLLATRGHAYSLDEPELVTLEFVVTAPESTARDAKLFLAGNVKALGAWSPTGVPLSLSTDGRHHATVKVAKGAFLEFKVTRGAWGGEEEGADGNELKNRTHQAKVDAVIEATVARWHEPSARKARRSTISGTVLVHERFASKVLGNERTLSVYLPPNYDSNPLNRFPVLYMQDGQNVFDEARSAFGAEWGADEIAERLISTDRIRPLIIVAIDNTPKRIDEYTPTRPPGKEAGGAAPLYGRFLVDEVKPFVDRMYRTLQGREHTAVAGSSLGALASLHIAMEHKKVFGACAALSPALWWDDRSLIRDWKARLSLLRGTRFWVDIGTREGVTDSAGETLPRAVEHCRELIALFDAAGLIPGRDYYYTEVALASHNEAAWAARFDKALLYLFGK